jgi:hypothetical protein
MKRLTLDFFHRWWWALAIIAVLEFRLGWSIASRPGDSFEFWAFQLALWPGAMLLSLDLRRGVARAVLALPLTARQIGRSWWTAAVAIPAIALAALLFSGAATFHYFHPAKIFPANRLALASLFALPWLGTAFTAIYGINNDVIFGSWRQRASATFFSILSMVMLFGGMLTLQDSTKAPVKFAIYLGVGMFLIIAGWFRAERFALGRASFRIAALPGKTSSSQHRAPGGSGGMPFLIGSSFVRIFAYVASMVALMGLLLLWHGQKMSQSMSILMFAGMGSFMACGFIVVFQLLPALPQLRLWQTLPVSPTRLATVMIGMVILPLIALGALVSGVMWLALGTSAALTCLNSYTFILAPASLCVFFAVWRGAGITTYVLLLVTLFGFQQVQLRLQVFLHLLELPINLAGPIAVASVLLAFLLTRRVLLNSRSAYPAQ